MLTIRRFKTFGWCSTGQSSDFGSSYPIKFWGSIWALLLVDHVQSDGLEATQARQVLV
jgi:hypothetical protein